jgi:hypothetical protein
MLNALAESAEVGLGSGQIDASEDGWQHDLAQVLVGQLAHEFRHGRTRQFDRA